MPLAIKICGLSTEETLDAATGAGADMVGFVFVLGSPRHVTAGRAAELRRRVKPGTEVVALTVDADDATLAEIVERVSPDWLQLHGSETPDRVAALKQRFGRRVMKAVGVRGAGDLAEAEPYLGVADRILFDAKPPLGTALPGGNGIPFNWRLLRDLDRRFTAFMVGGGLDQTNVADAIDLTGATGVDVSSGVETAPGRKDSDLIRGFVAAARLAEVRAARGAA
ncbi:MAG: phosphoribosylanthranilate isomerase [Bauldia sp.]|nr:phosphoribosylanthranilate isomerase [Bauldia sp.]